MIPHQFNHGEMTPSDMAHYRQQSATAPYIHIRKRCACSAVVTAKQLAQAGACSKCVRNRNEVAK